MAPMIARTVVMVSADEPGASLVAEEATLLILIADKTEWVAKCRLAQGSRPRRCRRWMEVGMSLLSGETRQGLNLGERPRSC
jgi:hypothetical protein